MIQLLHASFVMFLAAGVPTGRLDFTVERPPAGAYGVVTPDRLLDPITVTIQKVGGPVFSCTEVRSSIKCILPTGWYAGAGHYILTANAREPTQGGWRQELVLPEHVSEMTLTGNASLRYGSAGLRFTSALAHVDGSEVLAMSNRNLSATLPSEKVGVSAAVFTLTNVGEIPLAVQSTSTSAYGSLWKRSGEVLERVRDGDMCSDLFVEFQSPLAPGTSITVTDKIVTKSLPPGTYEYKVFASDLSSTTSPRLVYWTSYVFHRN